MPLVVETTTQTGHSDYNETLFLINIFIAVWKDSYVVYASGFDRSGK